MHSSHHPEPPRPSAAGPPGPAPDGTAATADLLDGVRRLRTAAAELRDAEPPPSGRPDRRSAWDRVLRGLDDADGELAWLTDDRRPRGADGAEPVPRTVGTAEWSLLTDAAVWSPDLYGLFGRAPEDGPLTLDELPSWLAEEDRPALTSAVTGCLIDGRAVRCVFRVHPPDGAPRTVRLAGEPVLDETGGTVAMWAVLREVPEGAGEEPVAVPERPAAGTPAGVPPAVASPPAVSGRATGRGTARFVGAGSERPGVPGALDLAGAWTPDGAAATGTWHDWRELPDGETVLSVGAVSGGDAAATAVGAVRGIALTGTGPGRLLGHLQELLDHGARPALASALCCRYRPSEAGLTWAQAGPQALLLCRGGAGWTLPPPTGTGGTGGYAERTERLAPGDTLVLVTDGLFPEGPPERSGRQPGDTASRLVAVGPAVCAAATARDAVEVVLAAGTAGERTGAVLVARVG